MPTRSRVAVAEKFGGPDVITIDERDMPDLAPGGVRVAVRAAGVNQLDARRRAGSLGGEAPVTLGGAFAGVVVESNDAGWEVGEEVIGWGAEAAAADLVDVTADRLAARPGDMEWELAAGLPAVGQAALSALQDFDLEPNDVIVIHGAAGGVGTALIQLAVTRGLRVIATAAEENREYLRELGAVPVTEGDDLSGRIETATEGDPVAASIDLRGTPETGEYADSLEGAGGAAITLVPETRDSHGIAMPLVKLGSAQMLELLDAVSAGRLKLPVETVPLADVAEAHRRLYADEVRGALVLDLSDNPHL